MMEHALKFGRSVRTGTAEPSGEPDAEALAAWFRVLADPTRIRILSLLRDGEMCVSDLAAALGMTQSAVSHQLRYLRVTHFVKHRRQGTTVYYAHDDAHTSGLLQMAADHMQHVRGELC